MRNIPIPNADELVRVIGPIDNSPGKKAKYKARWMKRGLAMDPAVRGLGIEIVEHDVDLDGKVEVVNEVVRKGPGRPSKEAMELKAAKEEMELLKAQMEEMKAKLDTKTKKEKTNADQA